jgi:hypothetical protein
MHAPSATMQQAVLPPRRATIRTAAAIVLFYKSARDER